MGDDNHYLKLRNGRWHYCRRVPKRFAHLDPRKTIEVALGTASHDVAIRRRDAVAEADEALWETLGATGQTMTTTQSAAAYERARRAALALGFSYKTIEELAGGPSAEVVARLEALEARLTIGEPGVAPAIDALLGGVDVPKTTITEALGDYITIQGPIETKGKSANQAKSWEKVKRRAVANFVRNLGDKAMVDIDRADAVAISDWWSGRVSGAQGTKKLSGNSANRDLGNLRLLHRWHFGRLGDTRQNPFDGLSFRNPKTERKRVLPFSTDWIRDKLLVPAAWNGLNCDAALIFLALVETGCRPSEIANLLPDQIRLDEAVPHVVVEPRDDRAIKTDGSARAIPLVGVSLAALQAAPQGFPRYHDKETTLSNTLMKHMKTRGLLPSSNHRVYSIRHAFDDRTLQGDIDRDLRARLMGHAVQRPDYGEGGTLAFRRDELLKIALPFPSDLVPSIVDR
ncbi:MAG: DUF6538 domain-containing protein [Pseudomonadota bacterium]